MRVGVVGVQDGQKALLGKRDQRQRKKQKPKNQTAKKSSLHPKPPFHVDRPEDKSGQEESCQKIVKNSSRVG
jgi:hypothetical protein